MAQAFIKHFFKSYQDENTCLYTAVLNARKRWDELEGNNNQKLKDALPGATCLPIIIQHYQI